jgi:hypothetical protein
MTTYKITTKNDYYFIDATAEEIKSELFIKIWEAMEFESVKKWTDPDWNEAEVLAEEAEGEKELTINTNENENTNI